MARRRRTDLWGELFDLLREVFRTIHPAWSIPLAVVLFAVLVAWFQFKVEQPALRQLGFLIGGIPAVVALAAGLSGWLYRREQAAFRRANVDIEWLNSFSWQEFERLVANLYRADGYMVGETGGGGADGGIDVRLRKDGKHTIVQCKRWKRYKVGVKPVRELFGVLSAEQVDRAVFITSGVYTQEALDFAKDSS